MALDERPEVSRTRRFLFGVGAGYVQQAVMILAGLWLTRFLLESIGQEQYGGWLIVYQLLLFLDLVDLGVIALTPREVAYATGREQHRAARAAAVAAVVARVRRVLWSQMPLAIGAATLFWLVARSQLPDVGVAVEVIALCYVVLFPTRIYHATLQGLQDLAALGWSGLAAWIVQLLVTVVLVLAGLGFWALAIGWACNRFLSTVYCWYRLRTAFPGVLSGGAGLPYLGEGSGLVGRGLWVSVGRVSHMLLSGADVIILGQMVGPAIVVAYACTAKLPLVFVPHLYSLAVTAEPALSELRTTRSRESLTRASTALGQLMVLLGGLLACVVLATNEGFVTWWVGADLYAGSGLTITLLAAILVRQFTFANGHLLFCLGYEKALAVVGIADGVITVAATVILVGFLGPIGAPLASLLGVCFAVLPATICLLERDADISCGALFAPHLRWLWRFGLLVLVLAGLGQAWSPGNVLSLIVTGVGVCLAYALVMAPIVRRSALGCYLEPLLSSVKRRLSRLVKGRPSSRESSSTEQVGVQLTDRRQSQIVVS
jgi:O-antigen/teichoic acid export membrane protein